MTCQSEQDLQKKRRPAPLEAILATEMGGTGVHHVLVEVGTTGVELDSVGKLGLMGNQDRVELTQHKTLQSRNLVVTTGVLPVLFVGLWNIDLRSVGR